MNEVAKPDHLFVCCACGKVSHDRYGMQKISQGWDEACMLNSNEFAESDLVWNEDKTRVTRVMP